MKNLVVILALTSLLSSSCSKKPTAPKATQRSLERRELLPASTVLYGSIDSKILLAEGKTNASMYAQLITEDLGRKRSWAELKAEAKNRGVDFDKVGRTIVLGVAVPTGNGSKGGASFRLVMLTSSAAYSVDKLRRKETFHGVTLYATRGQSKGRTAVMGKTAISGATDGVKHVILAGLGKVGRLGSRSPLERSIRQQRAAHPKLNSFAVMDMASLHKQFPTVGLMWVKNLKWMSDVRSVGVFLQEGKTMVQLHGDAPSLAAAAKLLETSLPSTRRGLDMALKELSKTEEARAGEMLRDIAATLKTVQVSRNKEALLIRIKAPFSSVSNAFGLITSAIRGAASAGATQ